MRSVLLDTVTLNDWRSVVNGALQAAKAGDPQARNWLGQYLMGRPEGNGCKPKGMHWATFERLEARHDALVNLSLTGMMTKFGPLRELMGR